jgi:hypothetical protein
MGHNIVKRLEVVLLDRSRLGDSTPAYHNFSKSTLTDIMNYRVLILYAK